MFAATNITPHILK